LILLFFPLPRRHFHFTRLYASFTDAAMICAHAAIFSMLSAFFFFFIILLFAAAS